PRTSTVGGGGGDRAGSAGGALAAPPSRHQSVSEEVVQPRRGIVGQLSIGLRVDDRLLLRVVRIEARQQLPARLLDRRRLCLIGEQVVEVGHRIPQFAVLALQGG